MVKNLLKVSLALLATASFATAQIGGTLYGVKGDKEQAYKKVLDSMEDKGYILSDPHERINDAYKTKYGWTVLDNLGFFSTSNDAALQEIMAKFPEIGGFAPCNLHIYKKKDEDITWYGHLNPYTMADIVGLKDKTLRKKFADSFKGFDELAKSIMKPTMEHKVEFDKLPKVTMMKFEIPIEGSLEDFKDEIQEKWEGAFEDHGYIVAGYKDFKEVYDDLGGDFPYDQYWVYGLCHFKFSNGVFNAKKGARPDAGIFAPCAVYMYVKPGGKVLHVGMPLLENWIAVMNIKNEKFKKAIRGIDSEIIKIFTTELGAKKVN